MGSRIEIDCALVLCLGVWFHSHSVIRICRDGVKENDKIMIPRARADCSVHAFMFPLEGIFFGEMFCLKRTVSVDFQRLKWDYLLKPWDHNLCEPF